MSIGWWVLPWFLTGWGTVGLALGTFFVWLRSRRVNVTKVGPHDLRISVLKPMVGLDPSLRENLETFRALNAHPDFEIIFCLASTDVGSYPLAKEYSEKYPERFRLVVGVNPALGNPKMAQLSVGYATVKNEFVVISDSNTETSQQMFETLVATWKDLNAEKRRPTLIHAPLVAVGGSGIGAALERMHLGTIQNASHELSLAVRVQAVVGKTLLFHKADLDGLGGIDGFGNYLGEDFMLGRAFYDAGTVRCISVATRNVLGETSVRTWFDRHTRWGVLRKSMIGWGFLFFEPMLYNAVGFVVAAFGVVPLWWVSLMMFGRALIDGANFWIHAKRPPALSDMALVPLKEFLLLAAWCRALVTRKVTWRAGVTIEMRRNSEVRAPVQTEDAR